MKTFLSFIFVSIIFLASADDENIVTTSQPNTILDISIITSWHAHIYYDAETRNKAWTLRETITKHIGNKVEIGRFHEKPVGPHPKWSFQLEIEPQNFKSVFEWLILNHGSLDILIHPNTGDALRDHKVSATFIGHSHQLILTNL